MKVVGYRWEIVDEDKANNFGITRLDNGVILIDWSKVPDKMSAKEFYNCMEEEGVMRKIEKIWD